MAKLKVKKPNVVASKSKKKKSRVGDGVMIEEISILMKYDFLSYTVANMIRSIPDYRDGLKPSHRRALYTLYNLGTGMKKSARIVGEMLGKYHPHGDQAAYSTIVRMAQDFKNNICLVKPQGNFGSIDGDSAASMRYTEAEMSDFTKDVYFNEEFIAVEMIDNFDGTLKEPAVLCPKIPVALINGVSGIATGVATSVPPHNITEVCSMVMMFLQHKIQNKVPKNHDALLECIKGPDFPTGGVVYDTSGAGIQKGLAHGMGQVWVLPKFHIEKSDYGRDAIIIDEMAYGIVKSAMIERIANLVKDGKLEGISDLRDESDGRNGIRVIIVMKKGVDHKRVVDYLVTNKVIANQIKYSMTFVRNNKPVKMGVYSIVDYHVQHRKEVLLKYFKIVIDKSELDLHLQEGLLIFIKNFKEVSTIVINGKDESDVITKLMKKYKLTKSQVNYILDTKMRKNIKHGEQVKAKIAQLKQRIKDFQAYQKNPYKYMLKEVEEIYTKYKMKRNTKVLISKSIKLDEPKKKLTKK